MSTVVKPVSAGVPSSVTNTTVPGASPLSKGERRPTGLDAFFMPQSVAVIGASDRPGSVGRTVFANLLANGSSRRVLPINPKRSAILDIPAHPARARRRGTD